MGRAWDAEGGRVGAAWEKGTWKGLMKYDWEVMGLGSGQGLGDWAALRGASPPFSGSRGSKSYRS